MSYTSFIKALNLSKDKPSFTCKVAIYDTNFDTFNINMVNDKYNAYFSNNKISLFDEKEFFSKENDAINHSIKKLFDTVICSTCESKIADIQDEEICLGCELKYMVERRNPSCIDCYYCEDMVPRRESCRLKCDCCDEKEKYQIVCKKCAVKYNNTECEYCDETIIADGRF